MLTFIVHNRLMPMHYVSTHFAKIHFYHNLWTKPLIMIILMSRLMFLWSRYSMVPFIFTSYLDISRIWPLQLYLGFWFFFLPRNRKSVLVCFMIVDWLQKGTCTTLLTTECRNNYTFCPKQFLLEYWKNITFRIQSYLMWDYTVWIPKCRKINLHVKIPN